MIPRGLALVAVFGFTSVCHAGTDAGSTPNTGFSIRPAILDSSNGTGSTLGLEFQGSGTPVSQNINEFNPTGLIGEAITGKFELKYDASGTVAADADRNPKDFLNAMLTASYVLGSSQYGSIKVGAFSRYEADQTFKSKQFVYGASLTYVKLGIFTQVADWVAVDVRRGRVDPNGDKAREAALGTSSLPQYYRDDFEADYHYDVRWKLVDAIQLESVELSYLYFLETAPPAQVEAAGLDRHHLATLRINFANNIFVAYSRGRLPFDKTNDKIYEIGLSYKLP
jgi:hypothetical protein